MPKTDPAKARQLIGALARLAAHPNFTPGADLTEGQFAAMAQDFVTDMDEFTLTEIDSAILTYRQDPRARGFPTPGRLRELASRARADRAAASRPSVNLANVRPCLWWLRPRAFWKPHWSEADIPKGELYQTVDGQWTRA